MPAFNLLVLMGNLTRSPETKKFPGDKSVTEFGIAVNRRWGTGADKKEEVMFADCKAWGKTGEFVAEYFDKGDAIHLQGRLAQERWEDKQSGTQRSKLLMVVDHATFVNSKGDGDDGGNGGAPAQRAPQRPAPARQPATAGGRRPPVDPPFGDEKHFEEADCPF